MASVDPPISHVMGLSLFVTNLPANIKKGDLKHIFREFDVTRIAINPPNEKNSTGKSNWRKPRRGQRPTSNAQVDFKSIAIAEEALATLHLRLIPNTINPTVLLLSASQDRPPITNFTSHGHPRIVKSLPPGYTDRQLYALIRPFGPLLLVRIDPTLGGIIQFWSEDDAWRAEAAVRLEFSRTSKITLQAYDPCNLFCSNLSPEVDEVLLEEYFHEFGMLNSTRIILNNKNKSRGYGFVAFVHADDACSALQALNGTVLGSKKITVRYHQPKPRPEPTPTMDTNVADNASSDQPEVPIWERSEGQPQEQPKEHPVKEPDQDTGEHPMKQPKDHPAEKPEEQSGESLLEQPEEHLMEESEERPREQSEEQLGERPREQSEEQSGERPREQPEEQPREQSGEESDGQLGEQPNEELGEQPEEQLVPEGSKTGGEPETVRNHKFEADYLRSVLVALTDSISAERVEHLREVEELTSQLEQIRESSSNLAGLLKKAEEDRDTLRSECQEWQRKLMVADSRRKIVELEADRPLWEEAKKRREMEEKKEQEKAEEARRNAELRESQRKVQQLLTEEKQRKEAERVKKEREEAERQARERQERERVERERLKEQERLKAWKQATVVEQKRCRLRDVELYGGGIWSKQTAMERFLLVSDEFSKVKFSEGRPLTFENIPWPCFGHPARLCAGNITWDRVEEFCTFLKEVLGAGVYKNLIEKTHRLFHPDRWRSRKALETVADSAVRKSLEDAGNVVSQAITPLWRETKDGS